MKKCRTEPTQNEENSEKVTLCAFIHFELEPQHPVTKVPSVKSLLYVLSSHMLMHAHRACCQVIGTRTGAANICAATIHAY